MRNKLLVVLLASLLICNLVFAVSQSSRNSRKKPARKIAQAKITDETFAMAPKVILDSSKSADALFANATIDEMFFSPALANDTIYAWLLKWESQNTSISIIKRTLDAETLTAKGDDITIETDIKSKIIPVGKAALGYMGFPTLKDSGKNTPDNLYFTILAGAADANTKPNDVKITDNNDKTLGFYIVDVLFQDNKFFVLFAHFNKTSEVELGIYLQGVKADDGSLLYDKLVEVVTFNNPAGTSSAVCGFDNATNADKIYILYKEYDTRATFQASVALADGKIEEPVELKDDTRDVMYFPAAVISADTVFGLALAKQTFRSEDDMSFTIGVYYNGKTDTLKTLALKTPKGYQAPMIRSFNYDKGFTIIAQFSGENNSHLVIKNFKSDGTAVAAQKTIGYTRGSMLFFVDASGALWAAYHDFEETSGEAQKTYLGKLLA